MSEFLINYLAWTVIYFVLLPLSMLLATPVVLVLAAISENPFLEDLKNRYRKVYAFWKDELPL